MLRTIVQRSVARFTVAHSFYAPSTLECSINPAEEGYVKNRKMMDEVNTKFT